ncbi:rod shape-determining protein RodA [Patescibacteria group bacterium]|nr:rod shape-determining protein RodA [Patescibacteria group bacterium]MBU1448876.1 rod shape-determining protein RodA [Patescibacteria group bacterium]MBU2612910.1 rod shape-determining protein RodA [Patescibacteria group bacterium]
MRRSLDIFIHFDWTLLLAATTLTVIGLLSIYGIGISIETGDLFQFKKQLVAATIGLALVFGVIFVDYRQIKPFALWLYGAGAALLVGVLVFGSTVRGMRGWFMIGRLSFQPVEIAKVVLAVFLASYLARHAHKRLGWVPFVGSGLAAAGYVGLVMLQPDLGSAFVMIAMWLVTVVFVGLPRRAWILLLVGAAAAGTLLWTVGLKPYQRDRLISFVQPAADPRGTGYNVMQARIAIGSGGLLGKGIGEGSQARLRFLPEASTDFMFSVIGEELGFVGLTIVLTLFSLLLLRFLRIAETSADPFAQILLVALVANVTFHLIVNAGMNLGVMPVTGIPLPFVSAAPSSLLVAFITVALAQSVAVRRQPAAFR